MSRGQDPGGDQAPRPGSGGGLAPVEYRRLRGRWPAVLSPADGLPEGETWRNIDRALRDGNRGLPGCDSLRKLLWRAGEPGSQG